MQTTKIFTNFSSGVFPDEITDKNQGWIYDINLIKYNNIFNYTSLERLSNSTQDSIKIKINMDYDIFYKFINLEIINLNINTQLITDEEIENFVDMIYNDYNIMNDSFPKNEYNKINLVQLVNLFNLSKVADIETFISSKNLIGITDQNLEENINLLFDEFNTKDING